MILLLLAALRLDLLVICTLGESVPETAGMPAGYLQNQTNDDAVG